MKKPREFPFEGARRLTANEAEAVRKAIERRLGKKRPRRGRPPKGVEPLRAVHGSSLIFTAVPVQKPVQAFAKACPPI